MGLWRWLLLIMGATPPGDEQERARPGAGERRGSRPLRAGTGGRSTPGPASASTDDTSDAATRE